MRRVEQALYLQDRADEVRHRLTSDAVVNTYASECEPRREARSEPAMAKYDPLTGFLQRQPSDKDTIRMSFQRLEEIIGGSLPPSARYDRTWWGNTVNQTRVQAHAWLNAVWKVQSVDLGRELVVFVRGRP
jgi:hypothetical protein